MDELSSQPDTQTNLPSSQAEDTFPGDTTQAINNIFDDDDDDDDQEDSQHLQNNQDNDGGKTPGRRNIAEEEEEDEEEEENSRRRRRREALEEEEELEISQRRNKKSKKNSSGDAEQSLQQDGQEGGGEDNGLPQMSDAELKRAMLDARIDAAVKSGKKKIKRRKKDDGEDLDPQADAEVAELRSQMLNAADDDVIANEERKPALAKLRMLPRVVDGLQKSHWQQSIFDSNLLEAVRRFLEPLPDKSLPALNIQRELFAALEKLSPSIDTISLKMSGLGKVVMFYSQNKRVEKDLRRRADRLIEMWSRPILKRSSSYRAMDIKKASYISSQSLSQSQQQQLLLSQSQSSSDPSRRNVTIPQPVLGGFKIAPRSLLDSADSDERSRVANASRERLNALKRKVKEAKKQ
ncbi:unnamed protein product [Sympodiomycopsis kandeliae]